jgi:hypothetical protein
MWQAKPPSRLLCSIDWFQEQRHYYIPPWERTPPPPFLPLAEPERDDR